MKGLGLLVATLVVFLLGTYGGYVAANIQGLATQAPAVAAPAPELDCSAGEPALQERKARLTAELRSLDDELHTRHVEAGDGPRPQPPGSLPEKSLQSLTRHAFGASVEILHCREYPCILVVNTAPSEEALADVRAAGMSPRVQGDGPTWAVVLELEAFPSPPRTAKRVPALLQLLGARSTP